MARSFSSRTLLAICVVLAVLLAALAVVQYRWSARVAAADAQRENEQLASAASLFAAEFNGTATDALSFLQNEAWPALQAGRRLVDVPNLIREIYYLDVPRSGTPQVRRLMPDGFFEASPGLDWIAPNSCSAVWSDEHFALMAPIFELSTVEQTGRQDGRVLKVFRGRPERCFVAPMNSAYLRDIFFPQLIRQSFGETAIREYNFSVISRSRPHELLFGAPIRADFRKPFFSVLPFPLASQQKLSGGKSTRQEAVFVQHFGTVVAKGAAAKADLFISGLWELDVAHKGMPLAAAFERHRRGDLLLSLGVEILLLGAIVFLVIGARRMQRLANQKMQFVAGVSHELRTPVSAIAMLARNQADGLVAGPEKVKQYGELIHQQSRRLNEMVEQALEYAGIHSGLQKRIRNEIDLRQLVEEAVEARREDLVRAGFAMELALAPDLPSFSGDRKLLRTAIDNLLSNAEKYADGERWIRISASYFVAEREVRISVEDRGGGIDPAERAEIFEPFWRGRAAIDSQIPGSGLGLSLVRSAVEAHQGSVTLRSEPGRGSVFTLHLPV